ncbi:hypothetical protein ES708_21756 [subsurface metagenome]
MHRCINDIFSYCKKPSLIKTETELVAFVGLSGNPQRLDQNIRLCRKDPHKCPYLTTQSQLPSFVVT